METIFVYKYEIFDFLKSIHQLEKLLKEEDLEEVYNHNYQIQDGIRSIYLLKENSGEIIKELKFDDLNFENFNIHIVTKGYARCPKCHNDEISYERFGADGKGEWVCWNGDCGWSANE